MHRRRSIIIAALITVLLGSLAASWTYPRLKKIEKHGPAPLALTAIIPAELKTTSATIETVFNNWSEFDRPDRIGSYKNKFPYGSQWSRFFLFRKDDTQHPSFPTDQEILLDRGVDAFVKGYVSIPTEHRTRDYYLYEPTGDYYWDSEYFYNGQPAKFRCSFLIHIDPAEKSGTIVEIFEYQPEIWVGEYLGLSAHAILPAMLHDIRPVEATTEDRKAVLKMIQTAALTSRPPS